MARHTRGRLDSRCAIERLEDRIILAAAIWDGGPSGDGTNWHDPVNWVGDVLPADGDDVTIDVAADPTITYSTGTLSLLSLITAETLEVTGGTLGVTGAADIDNTLRLNGGEIASGTWDVTGGKLEPQANSNNKIRDVAVVGDLTLDVSNGRTQILGTTTFGTARLIGSQAGLGFEGGASLPGDVVLDGAATSNRGIGMVTAGTLTIPAGRSISSALGFDGGATLGAWWWSAGMDLVNEGAIDITSGAARDITVNASTLGNAGTITVETSELRLADGFTNTGTVTVTAGELEIDGTWDNSGGVINVTDSPVELDGFFTTDAIGTINRAGSTVITLTGDLDNTGDTLAFDATSGSWIMLGGIVTGGQMTSADGAFMRFAASSNNRLQDVDVVGDLTLDIDNGRVQVLGTTSFGTARLVASQVGLGFEGGASIPGDISFEGAATTSRGIALVSAGTLTVPAGRSIASALGFDGGASIGSWWWSGSMDLINEGSIDFTSSTARDISINSATLDNSGTIDVDTAELRLSGGFINTGTITVTGGELELDGTWDNSAGIINVTDSTVELDGFFTTAAIGTLNRVGTTAITLTGDLDNTGDTFAFDASTGSWTLFGGIVTGGQITSADGETLRIAVSSSNRLQDVAVVGDLTLDIDNGRVQILGTTTFGTARLVGSQAGLGFTGGASLPGDVVLDGAATSNRGIGMVTAGTLTIPAGRSISNALGFDGGATLGAWWWSAAMDLVNEGAIDITSGAARDIVVNASTLGNAGTITVETSELRLADGFTNTGTVTVTAGELEIDGTWDNSGGVINVTDSPVELDGFFTTDAIGTINRAGSTVITLTGDLDNTGDTLAFDAASGSWIMLAGIVTGGQVTSADGAALRFAASSNNRLQDVDVVGDLTLDIDNGRVQILGTTDFDTARLIGSQTALGLESGSTLPGNVVLEGSATTVRAITLLSDGSLTIPSGLSVDTAPAFGGNAQLGGNFWWTGDMTLVNEGDIRFEGGSGFNLSIQPVSFDNRGTTTSAGGEIRVRPDALANTGTLRAENAGTVRVDLDGVAFVNDGTLAAAPGSVVVVEDDLTLTASSVLLFEINGFDAGDIGLLQVVGTVAIAGTLSVVGVDGWVPDCVNVECITAGLVTGAFDTLDLPTPPEDHKAFTIFTPDSQSVRFAISSTSDWNEDGRVDTLDFLAFLNDWVAGEESADFNEDGQVNTLDFLAFLNAWTSAC